MVKAYKMMVKQRELMRNAHRMEVLRTIQSDKFDMAAVGYDIDPEEFLENEIFFETL